MVIEVMANVNVPFGTVNRRCRGQEEIEGRKGIIYLTLPLVEYPQWAGRCLGSSLYVLWINIYCICVKIKYLSVVGVSFVAIGWCGVCLIPCSLYRNVFSCWRWTLKIHPSGVCSNLIALASKLGLAFETGQQETVCLVCVCVLERMLFVCAMRSWGVGRWSRTLSHRSKRFLTVLLL